MYYYTKTGKELEITRQGVDAILPLIRQDSKTYSITKELWGVYTPSTGMVGALLLGTEEACNEAIKEVSDEI
jgi:hypothetical protein